MTLLLFRAFSWYTISGTVIKNGVIQQNVPVTVQNLSTGDKQTIYTDNDGKYIFYLEQLNSEDIDTDEFKVTALSRSMLFRLQDIQNTEEEYEEEQEEE